MKSSNLIIRIPEPCHEDWNAMHPDAKGKFCTSCSKAVFDFSNKTDDEIKNILVEYKDQKVCGHFKKTQIDRPLNINLSNLPKNISATKAFAIALFLVFGTFLFSCTNPQGKKVNGIEVTNTKEDVYMVGELAMPITETLKGDTVVEEDSVTTLSYTESHIQGGLVYEEPTDTIFPTKEIAVPEVEETHVLGQMVAHEVFKLDKKTAAVDSVFITDTEKKISDTNNKKQIDLLIYPNPSNGEFTIKYDVLKRADIKIDVFDEHGALLKNVVNQSKQFEGKYQIPVNLNDLPNGIYLVSILNNGKRLSQSVVITK